MVVQVCDLFNTVTCNKLTTWHYQQHKWYSTVVESELVDSNTFEKVCEETLNQLAEYFEELVGSDPKLEKGDVVYGVSLMMPNCKKLNVVFQGGVLTIDLGQYGTYVINRQSPNRQIWLSSPSSGPKRFDYIVKEGVWMYRHSGQTLHELLKEEFEHILGRQLKIPVYR